MLRLSLLTAVGRLTMVVILKRCDGKFVGDFDAWSTRWTPPDQPDNIYDTLHESKVVVMDYKRDIFKPFLAYLLLFGMEGFSRCQTTQGRRRDLCQIPVRSITDTIGFLSLPTNGFLL